MENTPCHRVTFNPCGKPKSGNSEKCTYGLSKNIASIVPQMSKGDHSTDWGIAGKEHLRWDSM